MLMTIENAESILRSIKELKTPVFTEEEKQVISSSAFTGFGVMIPTEDDIQSYLWGNYDAEDYFSKIDSAEELTEDFRLSLWNGRIHK